MEPGQPAGSPREPARPETVGLSVQWPLAVAPFGVTRTTRLLETFANTGRLYLATVPCGIDPGVEARTVHRSAAVSHATARTLRIDRIDIVASAGARLVYRALRDERREGETVPLRLGRVPCRTPSSRGCSTYALATEALVARRMAPVPSAAAAREADMAPHFPDQGLLIK